MSADITLRVDTSFNDIRHAYRDIVQCTACRTLSNDNIVDLWYDCYKKRKDAVIFSLWDGNICIGIYPFFKENKHGLIVLNTLFNDSLSISHPVVRRGHEDVFYQNFIKLIFKSKFRWNSVKFSYVFSFDKEFMLLDYSVRRQASHLLVFQEDTYSVDATTRFDDYLHKFISKNVRKTYSRRMRRLLKHKDVAFNYYFGVDAKARIDEFFLIQEQGWKDEKGYSLFKSSGDRDFVNTVVEQFCADNKAVLAFLEVNGVNVAGQLCHMEDGILHLTKSVYNVHYKDISPSTLLFMNIVEKFSTQFKEIHKVHVFPYSFGYKYFYCHSNDKCLTYTLFNKDICSIVACCIYKIKETVRHYLRKRAIYRS